MASEPSGVVTAQVGAWTVQSNSGDTKEQIEERLTPEDQKAKPEEKDDDEPDLSKAAADLGKAGGKAAAEKRAADAKAAKKQAKADEKAEAAPEGEEPEPEKPLGKPRDDPRARMLEATRKESEAKKALATERAEKERLAAEIQSLRSEVESIKRGPVADKAAGTPTQPEKRGKPVADDYDSYEAYLDARDEFNREQVVEDLKKKETLDHTEKQIRGAFDKFYEAMGHEALDQTKDTIGRLRSTFNLKPGEKETGENWLANEIVFSPEHARPLALHLHEHPDELQRIAALSTPRQVTFEVARLVTRLEAATTGADSSPKEEVSKAAPPVKPVAGAPYVADSDTYREGMSLDEYARIWNKQHRVKR